LFKKWITTSITIEDLSARTCSRNLRRHFDLFLSKPPAPKKLDQQKQIYLKVDGTYFRRWGCALCFKENGKIILWDFVERENYFNYCKNILKIKELGYCVIGITSDWHGSIVSCAKTLLPNIPHQRCLVHTKRLCQTLLTKRPETQAGQDLLSLVKELTNVKTDNDKKVWILWLGRFKKRYEDLLNERTYSSDGKHWWFTHRNIRRVFRTLDSSIDNLFLYLEYPNLSSNTNDLEAEFTHLKQKLSIHKGLKRSRRINFIKWYFYFKSI